MRAALLMALHKGNEQVIESNDDVILNDDITSSVDDIKRRIHRN